jgi:hypothetical protein
MLQNSSRPKSERSLLIVWVFSEHLLNIFVSGEHMRNNSSKMKHVKELKNGCEGAYIFTTVFPNEKLLTL